MSVYQANLEVNGIEDVPVTVHYTAYPFIAGGRDGLYGPKIEPDEPARIEIDWVGCGSGKLAITKEQERAIADEIGEYLDQQDQFERENQYEREAH